MSIPAGPVRRQSIDRIEGLDRYHLYHSARAELLQRLGRTGEAAYGRALELATNPVERRFLERRRAEVQDSDAHA